MTWRIIPASQFGEFQDQWQALNARSGDSPVLHPDFILPLLAEFGTGTEYLAICDASSGPIAMAIFSRLGSFSWQTFQPANAPLGLWISDGTNSVESLLSEIVRALPTIAGLVGVLQQDPDLAPRPTTARGLCTLDYFDTARISVAGTFEHYWSQRGKNLRRNVKRQQAALEREGVKTRLEVLHMASDMERAVADYARLESAGWKSTIGTAVGDQSAQARFYVEMMQRFCSANAGQVFRYFYGEDIVASDICVSHGDVLVILKTTYDESIKKTSPAQLMRHEMFELLFNQKKFHRIEFYGRVMDWHRQWTDEIRTMYHINHYRWSLLRAVHAMTKTGARSAPARQEVAG
jgi:CelD/BcsL family acetyltransferase involved in cellulose biosynthesis